jgi:phosphoenolpyruvate carboxykinase (ATP)
MKESQTIKNQKGLETYGLIGVNAHWNLTPDELQKITIQNIMGRETSNGTLAINTGKFTGRSPQDRFIVKDNYTTGLPNKNGTNFLGRIVDNLF